MTITRKGKLVTIVGPTSSGKTSLALSLCKKLGGVIVAADSRQIYKDFDIGTGKVPIKSAINIQRNSTHWLLDEIPVWGYDIASPDKLFTAYDFVSYIAPIIDKLLKAYPYVFVVGGTGFYIDCLLGRIKLSHVPPNFELRKELSLLPLHELGEYLLKLNPEVSVDMNNPVRIVRAIEKQLHKASLDKVEKTKLSAVLPDQDVTWIGITSERNELFSKVDSWVNSIIDDGLLDEVQTLVAKGYRDTFPMKGIVYKTALSFVNNEIDMKDLLERTKFDLHAYIRRQQTWFKKNPSINWLDFSDTNFSKKALDLVLYK